MVAAERFALAIVGPTASGKSAVAIALAERLDGEIVSADSMMVYRGMDIGTAKPPLKLRQSAPHHLIDILEPSEDCSAALYQRLAAKTITDIFKRGRLPVVVGGTGLYVSAALDDLTFPTVSDTREVRRRLEKEADELGEYEMHSRLNKIDPVAAASINVKNVRRVIRALEVYELTGHKFSESAGAFKKRQSVYDTVFIGIDYDRDELKRRIRVRTERMLEHGWVDEVRRLYSSEKGLSATASQAIGYKTLNDYINGRLTKEEAVENINRMTSAYAKRQMTWFNADSRVVWLKPAPEEGPTELADRVILYLKSNGRGVG
jgi:tRNA dimethylallyltransferase